MNFHISINQNEVEVADGETLLETARRTGQDVPSLCYDKNAIHKSSCMICAVKDCDTGQILPSCSTFPTEGMRIDTESDDVLMVRTLSLELLLSDHRADCEAPCSLVCTQGLDIERVLYFCETGLYEEAYGLMSDVFALPALGCDDCKAPCEKVCRRGTVDEAIPIRAIMGELARRYDPAVTNTQKDVRKVDKTLFQSRVGKFTESEKRWLREHTDGTALAAALNEVKPETRNPKLSGCLHCACAGRGDCKLRLYATAAGIKRPRYEASSVLQAAEKQHVIGDMWFEPAKCIRCGLCVYNSRNGFTFRDRGFGMQVVIPEENRTNVDVRLAKLCPTGALYVISGPF